MKTIALYATDTMADWEYSYLVAGIAMAREQAPGRYQLKILSDGGGDVCVPVGAADGWSETGVGQAVPFSMVCVNVGYADVGSATGAAVGGSVIVTQLQQSFGQSTSSDTVPTPAP